MQYCCNNNVIFVKNRILIQNNNDLQYHFLNNDVIFVKNTILIQNNNDLQYSFNNHVNFVKNRILIQKNNIVFFCDNNFFKGTDLILSFYLKLNVKREKKKKISQ